MSEADSRGECQIVALWSFAGGCSHTVGPGATSDVYAVILRYPWSVYEHLMPDVTCESIPSHSSQ